LFVTTPTGWVTALALGIGAAVGSLAAGKGTKYMYNQYGRRIDLVGMTNTDQLCR